MPRAVLVRCAGVDVARARVRGAPVIPVAAALRLAFVVSVVWGAPTGIRLGWVQVRRWASEVWVVWVGPVRVRRWAWGVWVVWVGPVRVRRWAWGVWVV
ncbi:hypothetical protein CO60_0266 [Mycobacterium tuberculosis]|nr:hypothetical protein CO60_0266 [Mycobacterium tuberculosis]GAA43758.1 hypothetical protein NCGM2209_0356 [Mycobacterium tuberculosis NCGM2209]